MISSYQYNICQVSTKEDHLVARLEVFQVNKKTLNAVIRRFEVAYQVQLIDRLNLTILSPKN